ncbi:signal peptide peptidase SppA [Stigmatella sp. ncwal1]|uniref:Signal peptide peptidase SppA n=1 Tax=Stigmatella ashevillensis TaxID=2995309 RepID=A0ABT5D3E8_9BACT|nr:signal peptide peptidase SppA [Stigmatella ashevillena]MDC0707638.1 signal peptide peptidase SppA [Stigmatella ashevillena]
MVRLVFVALANLLLLIRTLLGLPFRLLASRHRPAYVRFRLSGDMAYRERRRSRWRWGLRGAPPEPATVSSLESFREALGLLAKDPEVKGILLELEGLAVSSAKKDELVKQLLAFRSAGKRVVGWAVSVDNLGFQVLCAADEVLLAPAGRVDLVGYAAEATALGEGLARVGIQAHFVRRGAYKTAPELFTHERVSDIQQQTMEAFLDERYAELVNAIARGRKRSAEEAKALIDAGPYSAQRAVTAGLVDALCSEAELPARLDTRPPKEKKQGEDEPEEPLEAMESWLAALPFPPVKWRPVRRRPKLGLVSLSGMIVSGRGSHGPIGPKTAGSEAVVKAVRAAGRDKRAKAVVLYINSPGGSALASEIILEAIQRVARKKPVIAYVDQVAASGGYMAALGAQEIWSSPHAVVGSIGVFAGKFEASGLLEHLGIHRTLLTRGDNAGIFSVSRGFTPHERASLEAEVEETYQAFLAHVAKARGRTKEEIHERGEGRVFSGTRGLAAGLVDRLGSFEDACRHALERAGVKTEHFELAIYGGGDRRASLLQLLLSGARTHLYAFCPTAWSLTGQGPLTPGEPLD